MRASLLLTAVFLCAATLIPAAQIPAGTELSIRLLDKISSDKLSSDQPSAARPVSETAPPQAQIHAALIMPVLAEGRVVLPLGVLLTGEVKQARPAADKQRAQLQLVFTQIGMGVYRTPLSAVVAGIDNSRETVDDQGIITGIDGSAAYGARIDQGIAKLQNSDRFAELAGIIQEPNRS